VARKRQLSDFCFLRWGEIGAGCWQTTATREKALKNCNSEISSWRSVIRSIESGSPKWKSRERGLQPGVVGATIQGGLARTDEVTHEDTRIPKDPAGGDGSDPRRRLDDDQQWGQATTLPQTIALEQQLLSANSGNVGSIQSNYTSVYGALPASTAIPADSRIAMDMTDAQAQAAMKKAIALDAIANREEQLSQQMMQQLSSSAPGSGSLISAQAAAWNLQANAYSQGAIAQLLRLESASTAYSGYQMKHMSASHQTANQTVQTILSN